MNEIIFNIVFVAMITLTALFIASGCTTTANLQERIDCRQACGYDGFDEACSGMFWTICDCANGKRIRISNR